MTAVKTGRLKGAVPNSDLVSKLTKAMRVGLAVVFRYDGKLRVVEVHALGTSTKDGSVLMRGVQTKGDSSRPLPQWTLFTVDKIEGHDIALSFEDSLAPREGYKQNDAQFNELIAELIVG